MRNGIRDEKIILLPYSIHMNGSLQVIKLSLVRGELCHQYFGSSSSIGVACTNSKF